MIKNIIEFRNELEKINEWWITSKIRIKQNFLKRKELFRIIEELSTRRIITILGPRRVGKTTSVKQTIEFLIKEKNINPRNILYYSMDDPTLFNYSDMLLKDMIDYFIDNISDKNLKYIFLDEAHLYKEWYKWIKSYYDKYEDIKFILTGSSSLTLSSEANKFLKGRTIEIIVFPLTFIEFLEMLGESVSKIPYEDIFKIDEFKMKEMWYKIKDYFNEYLLVGGFPEYFELRNGDNTINRWFDRLINDIPKKAIYEDIANIFSIKNPKILELIFTFIAYNQSKILAYETINDIAKLDRATLLNYIEFLKSSYIVVEVLKYSRNIKEQLKSKRKFLIIDQGLRNAVLRNYQLKEDNLGFVVENTIGIQMYLTYSVKNKNVFYYRINDEIDFVIGDENPVPVEVKYRENIDPPKRQLLNFMQKFNSKTGIIITKNLLKREEITDKIINHIPAWLFLISNI